MLIPLAKMMQDLLAYRYIFMFPIAVVEGPMITMIAGFVTSLGYLNFFVTYAVLVAGDMAGDALYYLIGYYGRTQFINRWGHYIGLDNEKIASLENHFSGHAGKTLIIGKITQVAGAPVLVAAGAAKTKFGKFMFYTTAGTLPKTLILLLIGYYFGLTLTSYNKYLNYAGWAVLGLLAIAGLLIFLTRKKKRKKK